MATDDVAVPSAHDALDALAAPDAPPSPILADPPGFVRYPPFPSAPLGVSLIPFKSFVPAGIRVGQGDAEVDALGIKTVRLRAANAGGGGGGGKKKKKKKGGAAAAAQVQTGPPKKWWEVWAETEKMGGVGPAYASGLSPRDRVERACEDFEDRDWGNPGYGLHQLWDQYRRYIGALGGALPKLSHERAAPSDAPLSDDEDDEEDEVFTNLRPAATVQGNGDAIETDTVEPKNEPIEPIEPDEVPLDEEAQKAARRQRALQEAVLKEATRMERDLQHFLSDPERKTKVFFSRHFQDKGLQWNERRCQDAPRLVLAFFDFIVRNKAFTDDAFLVKLAAARAVAEQALVELPATFGMSLACISALSEACKSCWGAKYQWGPGVLGYSAEPEPSSEDAGALGDPESEASGVEELPEHIPPARLLDVADLVAEGALGDAAADALDENTANVDLTGINDGVDASSGQANSWGTGDSSGRMWGDGADSGWGEAVPAEAVNIDPPVRPNLLRYLGPTVLPLTHTTGVVEESPRRVVAVLPPATPNQAQSVLSGAAAVEDALARRFARIHLAPWGAWDLAEGTYITSPQILHTSVGPVVHTAADGTKTVDARSAPESRKKPHDPLCDDIWALIEPEGMDKVRVGMGIGAMWVQIVRQPGATAADATSDGTFWYIEHVLPILPSFYADPPSQD